MTVEALLSFLRTPYPDAVICESLDYKGRFFIYTTYTVKHEYEKYIELLTLCGGSQFLYSVTVCGRYLKTGNSFFKELLANDPALSFSELTADLSLHGNIIFDFIDLPYRRYSVQAVGDWLSLCVYNAIIHFATSIAVKKTTEQMKSQRN